MPWYSTSPGTLNPLRRDERVRHFHAHPKRIALEPQAFDEDFCAHLKVSPNKRRVHLSPRGSVPAFRRAAPCRDEFRPEHVGIGRFFVQDGGVAVPHQLLAQLLSEKSHTVLGRKSNNGIVKIRDLRVHGLGGQEAQADARLFVPVV